MKNNQKIQKSTKNWEKIQNLRESPSLCLETYMFDKWLMLQIWAKINMTTYEQHLNRRGKQLEKMVKGQIHVPNGLLKEQLKICEVQYYLSKRENLLKNLLAVRVRYKDSLKLVVQHPSEIWDLDTFLYILHMIY